MDFSPALIPSLFGQVGGANVAWLAEIVHANVYCAGLQDYAPFLALHTGKLITSCDPAENFDFQCWTFGSSMAKKE